MEGLLHFTATHCCRRLSSFSFFGIFAILSLATASTPIDSNHGDLSSASFLATSPFQSANWLRSTGIKLSGQFDDLTTLSKVESGQMPDQNSLVPLVDTPLGQLRGQAMRSRSGRWYYAYRGIPYAEPPKRFQPSVPVQPWNGTRDARNPGNICVQPGPAASGGIQGSEDCLFLEVYFPDYKRCKKEESSSGKLPVLFNIHGGSYSMGAGSMFGTKYLLDECIVLVSINYRLGALGFLTTEDGLISGNLGLKDQSLALQWTKKYISHFRGDPESVTLMGISAGGSSVSHHVTSPMSKGLFHRAICQSGSTLNPWSVSKTPNFYAGSLGQLLNCSIESTSALKSCLEATDVKQIIAKQSSAGGNAVPFGPVIEPEDTLAPFQIQNPAHRLRTGDFSQVPLIIGFVEDEASLNDPQQLSILNAHWEQVAPTLFFYDRLGYSKSEMDAISTKIRQFYFGNEIIGLNTRQNMANLYSDRAFIQGIFENVQLHSKFAPVYPYVMSYTGGYSFGWDQGFAIPVMTHGDDAQFLFNDVTPESPFLAGTEQFEFSKNIVQSWVSFAKTGIPSSSQWARWTQAETSRSNAIWNELDLQPHNVKNYLDERRRFWENLGLYQLEFR